MWLEKDLAENPEDPRTLYYLGHGHWEIFLANHGMVCAWESFLGNVRGVCFVPFNLALSIEWWAHCVCRESNTRALEASGEGAGVLGAPHSRRGQL